MKFRTFVLAGAASMAIAGGALFATPGFAQGAYDSDENLSHDSTPAEQAQTENLNDRQYSHAQAGEQEQRDYDASRRQYDSQLRDYQQKDRAYQEQQRDYANQRQNYDQRVDQYGDQMGNYTDQADRYNRDARDYDEDAGSDQPPLYRNGDHAHAWQVGMALDDNADLYDAPVEDAGGYVVGHFRRIIHEGDGAEAVITLHNNKTIVVRTGHLRFDPDQDLVLADLNFNQLNSMEARF